MRPSAARRTQRRASGDGGNGSRPRLEPGPCRARSAPCERARPGAASQLALDRTALEHGPLGGLELVEPRGQQRLERRRDDRRRPRRGPWRASRRRRAGFRPRPVRSGRAGSLRAEPGSAARRPPGATAPAGRAPARQGGARSAQAAPCRGAGSASRTKGAPRARPGRGRCPRRRGCRRARPRAAAARRRARASSGRPRRCPRLRRVSRPRRAASGSRPLPLRREALGRAASEPRSPASR